MPNNINHTQPQVSSPNEDLIFTYTRVESLADGFEVDVSKVAKQVGLKYNVFITDAVMKTCVTAPKGIASSKKDAWRLWDVLSALFMSIQDAGFTGGCWIEFKADIINPDIHSMPVALLAQCGPTDIDDARPAITIMMPDEA